MPKPTMRRFFRYRLRTLLVLVFVVAVGLGMYRHFREQQRRQREFMTDAIPLGAKFTIKRWLSDRERECTDPAELGMMDDIVAVEFFGRRWDPHKNTRTVDLHWEWSAAEFDGTDLAYVDATHRAVRRVRDLPALERLGVASAIPIIDDDTLAVLEHLPRLEYLDLCGSNVTVAALPHIGRCTALKNLSLAHTKISDFGLKYLANLRKLEVLDLAGTDVFDDGLSHVRQFPNLTHLYLRGTQVRYANLSGLPNLQCVDLAHTPTVSLYLDGSRQVRTLDLGGTAINRDQVGLLRYLPCLQRLSLHETSLTGEDLVVLHQLPALESTWIDTAILDSQAARYLKEHSALKEVEVNLGIQFLPLGGTLHMMADQEKKREEKLAAIRRELFPLAVQDSFSWPMRRP